MLPPISATVKQSVISKLRQKIYAFGADPKFSEVFSGSVYTIGAKVMATALGLGTSIFVARFYGAEMVGTLSLTISFLMFATMLSVAGTNVSILRFIPEHVTRYSVNSAFLVYRKIFFFVVVVSSLFGIVFFFSADVIAEHVFSKPHLAGLFALASVFLLFNALLDLTTQAVRGMKLIRAFAWMQIVRPLLMLLLLCILTFAHAGRYVPVYALLIAIFISAIIGMAILAVSFKTKIQADATVHPVPFSTILRISLPMFMTTSMQYIVGQTGIVMLGMFCSDAEVGYYAVAVKLATLTIFALRAIDSMAAPKFSELFHSGKMDELFYVAQKSAKLIFWATVPLLLLLVGLGKPILMLFFGQEFVVAYWPLVFLVGGQFVNAVCGSTGYFMDMTGHQKILRNIIAVAAVMNIVLNVLLIPKYGIIGAALSAMISVAFWNLYTLVYIKIKYKRTIGYLPFCRSPIS